MKRDETRHLDFGSGVNPRNPFKRAEVYSVDVHGAESQFHRNIGSDLTIPFKDNYFDSVSAYDVLEHLSREGAPSAFVLCMNEMYRVLKSGGEAIFVFPLSHRHEFYDDPTHINPLTLNTFQFFCGDDSKLEYTQIQTHYEIVKLSRLRNWNRYVHQAQIQRNSSANEISWRRRLSLMKREVIRWLIPTHGIFIGRKTPSTQ
jgi:hypothetical protein